MTASTYANAILCGALALSVALQSTLVWRSPAVAPDAVGFIEMAQQLSADAVRTMRLHDQHPGYPALILATHTIVGRIEVPSAHSWRTAALIPPFVCGPLVVLFVWLFTRSAYDARAAGAAAIVVALLPVFRQNAADALSDTPHIACFAAALWLASEGIQRKRWPWTLAAGMLSGLAFWIRPEGLAIALVAGAFYAALAAVAPWTRRWRIAEPVALCCGVLLAAGPYVAVTGKLTSKITSKPNWVEWTGRSSLRVDVPERDETPLLQTVAFRLGSDDVSAGNGVAAESTIPVGRSNSRVSSAPRGPLGRIFLKALREFVDRFDQAVRYVLLIPLAFATFAPSRPRTDPLLACFLAALIVLLIGLTVVLYFLGGYLDQRHLMPLLLIVVAMAGAGVVWAADQLRRLPLPGLPRVAAWIPLLVVAAVVLPRTVRPLHQDLAHDVEAASWIRARWHPGDRVLTNSRHVLFYADVSGRVLGDDPAADALDARSIEYRFVAIDFEPGLVSARWMDELRRNYVDRHRVPSQATKESHDMVVFERGTEVARRKWRERST